MQVSSLSQSSIESRPKHVAQSVRVSFVLILATPLLFYVATYWGPESVGRQLVLGLSGPLFVAVCIGALWFRKTIPGRHSTILFSIVCLIYMGDFGLRALYLAIFPDLVTFPNVDPIHDQLTLHRALLWAQLGVLAMAVGYFTKPRTAAGGGPGPGRIRASAAELLRRASTPRFLLGLYLVGWIGRAYMVYTGSIYWFYNSPSFDLIADRPNPYVAGPLSLLSEFCPIAFGGLTAVAFSMTWRFFQYLVLAAMVSVEVFYFSLGLYKFGMIGALLIPLVALWLKKGRFPRKAGILLALVVVGLIMPITDALRSSNEYLRDIILMRPSLDLARIVPGEAREVYSVQHLNLRYFGDQMFQRLNGAEALIVAEKLTPPGSYYWGATYLNVAKLAVPRLLRFWSSEAFYIPWETDYVGKASMDPTVVPMPMLIEAFLNFGIVGVLVVMGLTGWAYRFVDSFGAVCSTSALGIGTYAYVVWKLADVELNLFGIFLTPLKAVLLLLFLVWVWCQAAGLQLPRRKSGSSQREAALQQSGNRLL